MPHFPPQRKISIISLFCIVPDTFYISKTVCAYVWFYISLSFVFFDTIVEPFYTLIVFLLVCVRDCSIMLHITCLLIFYSVSVLNLFEPFLPWWTYKFLPIFIFLLQQCFADTNVCKFLKYKWIPGSEKAGSLMCVYSFDRVVQPAVHEGCTCFYSWQLSN